jgi:cytochrome oxidase Cu insertion factor (SCO1/SenC/PrrC family)
VGRQLPLLSITFDPEDTPPRLREYAGHYSADGRSCEGSTRSRAATARVRHRRDSRAPGWLPA